MRQRRFLARLMGWASFGLLPCTCAKGGSVRYVFADDLPKTGDRVRIKRASNYGNFAGECGTVVGLGCGAASFRVHLDGDNSATVFQDYELAVIPRTDNTDRDPGDEAHTPGLAACGRALDAISKPYRSPLSLTDYPNGMPPQSQPKHVYCRCVQPDQPEPIGYLCEELDRLVAATDEATQAAQELADCVASWEADEAPDYHLGYADGFRFSHGDDPMYYSADNRAEVAGKRISKAVANRSHTYTEAFYEGFTRYLDELEDAAFAACKVA